MATEICNHCGGAIITGYTKSSNNTVYWCKDCCTNDGALLLKAGVSYTKHTANFWTYNASRVKSIPPVGQTNTNNSSFASAPTPPMGMPVSRAVDNKLFVSEPKSKSNGSTCSTCKAYNEYAEPNQPNGSYICYNCR